MPPLPERGPSLALAPSGAAIYQHIPFSLHLDPTTCPRSNVANRHGGEANEAARRLLMGIIASKDENLWCRHCHDTRSEMNRTGPVDILNKAV